MRLQEYYSVADVEYFDADTDFHDFDLDEREFQEDAPERWQRGELSDLFVESYHDCFPHSIAEEVHNFIRMVVHPYRRCFDSPQKSPKNEEIESAIRNKGQKGSCTFKRESGKFILNPLTQWMCYGHNLRRKHYYTSDNRIALLYHDIDCHLGYQTKADSDAARSLIEAETSAQFGVVPLFLRSDRGENGYLKVNLAGVDPQKANEIFDQYQEAVRLLFAKHMMMSDFEIKGTITYFDQDGKLHAGRYGKLPMCAGSWNIRWHESLVAAKTVTVFQLEEFIKKIKAEVTDDDIAKLKEAKDRAFISRYVPVQKDQRWRLNAKFGVLLLEDSLVSYQGQQWIAKSLLTQDEFEKWWPDFVPEVSCETTQIVAETSDNPAPTPKKKLPKAGTISISDLVDEPDSLIRQRTALLKLARCLKRIPTVDEALNFIRDNGLYSGTWANRARRTRVRSILKFIARTFDGKKCSKSGKATGTVNIGKYDQWAKAKFPNGLSGGTRRMLMDDLQVKEIKRCGRVEWEFVSVFVSVVEYCLMTEKNDDNSLPHERAKQLWKWMNEHGLVKVQFDNRKWAACRDGLEKLGVVKVTDRHYESNKAMRWAVGTFFPLLNLWKTKKVPSSGDAISVFGFSDNYIITEERQHNSLLHLRSSENHLLSAFGDARPPPGINSG